MKKNLGMICLMVLCALIAVGCSKADTKKSNTGENTTKVEQNQEGSTEDVSEQEEIDYVLFFRHKEKPFLFDEAYSIKPDDERLKGLTMEEFILNELINLQSFEEYINPIPKGTKLLSVEKKDGIIFVNLSKEFVEGQKGTSNDTLLSLATIINSLTILQENQRVQFMIEGQSEKEINGIDVSQPFGYIQGLYPDK